MRATPLSSQLRYAGPSLLFSQEDSSYFFPRRLELNGYEKHKCYVQKKSEIPTILL